MTIETIMDVTRLARSAGLSGDFARGHALLDEAAGNLGNLPRGEDERACALIAIERGRLFNSAGSRAQACPFFEQAWDLARKAGDHDLAVDAAHMMAIASPLPAAAAWTRAALGYMDANPAVSPFWRGMLHHNLGWTFFEAGQLEEALASFIREERMRRQSGPPNALKVSRYAVVRTLRALGRFDEAVDHAEMVVTLADQANDTAPFVYEELAECYAALGDAVRARHYAWRAQAILSGNTDFVRDEPVRLARLVALAGEDAAGDEPRS